MYSPNLGRQFAVRMRGALVLLLVASFVFVSLPTRLVFAGDSESPLQVRMLGSCDDASSRGGNGGLGLLAFGLGLDGTNLADTDPYDASEPTNGTFTVAGLPAGATVVEAWLYWNGSDGSNSPEDNPAIFNPAVNDGDPTITFGGSSPVTTTRVGGPVFFGTADFSYAHRTDVTAVVAANGNGSYALTGIDNLDNFVNGAELVVIYRDTTRDPYLVGLAEGLDLDPGQDPDTKPVFFQFDPAQEARTAQVTVFLGGAGYGTPETNALYHRSDTEANLPPDLASHTLITDTNATKITNPFTGTNNQNVATYWDSYTLNIPVPAGHSWVAIQVDSETITGTDARLEWVGATLNMPLACPQLLVSKTRTSADYVQPGEAVAYEIVVNNIGNTDVVSATLQDTYETTYLDFNAATPAPASPLNDGVLDWTNIGPIAYGSAVTVTVEFTAALSTEPITGPPADRTINTATVTDVVDENGKGDSANNYPSDDPSTPDDENPLSDTASVEITDPGVAIEKGLVTPADGDTIVGAEVVYTITVTNTGDTLLQTVPLSDTYDSIFLSYGYGGVFSSPASDDNNDDGSLVWANVGPLAVQASTIITVHFTANASTQNELNNQTINYAGVHNVVDENDDTVPADQAQAPVEIVNQGVIGDYVWYDTDGDGIQDVNESGLGNVTIDLKDGGGSVVATVATDADGGYIFTHLSADNYTVDITDSFGIIAGLTPVSGPESQLEPYTVHLGPGEIYRDADFAYVLDSTLAIVGDTVWYDPNQNGKRDAGEAGIQGVTVTLFDATTGFSTGHYAVTNINGNYLIGAVPAGTYYVQATAGIPAGVSPSSGAPSPSAVFVVVAGDRYLDADIGYVQEAPSEIAGMVWDDSPNENGLLDEAGNPGIPGVSVDLLDTNSKILATTTSDSNGNFSFPGLPPGAYQVQVSDTQNVLDDYVPTLIIGGTSDNTNKAQPYSVTLGTGMIDTTADFGYVLDNPPDKSGIIGNQVWYDRDGDGVYEPGSGDVGVEGVTVDLLNASGQVITSTITGASGDYVFTRLAPATYQVRVSDNYGVLAGFINTAFPLDQSADNNNKHQPYIIILPSAGINMRADFGYTAPAALGDFLWYDANNNGLQDVGESGLANVTLDLYDAGIDGAVGGGDDTLFASTVSDADGGYLFPNLSPGSYYVDVTDLNTILTTFSLTSGPQSQNDPSAVVSLSPGTVNKDIDFGYVQTPSNDAIIGDTVFYDGNGDGVQQPGEPGIPAVIVCATPDGGGSPTCDTSDSNGHYLLDVVAGAYTVAPTNPPLAYTATTSAPYSVTVTAGDQYLDADFGYHSVTLMGTIGDFVFGDIDASGDYSATVDAPFRGVSVDLIQDSNADGVWDDGEAIIATATTDENGQYLFSGVPTDDYLVHVSDTNAVLIDYVKAPLGAADTTDNNQADPYALNLGQGASVLTADFGYFAASRNNIAVIGNQVWVESDYDGLFDSAATDDFGQPGVSIALYRNGSYYGTTTTGASGDYSFTSLPSGVYTVTVSDSVGILSNYLHTFYPSDQVSDNSNKGEPYTINLSPAAKNLTADFGYVKPATVGNYVWVDMNGNSAQDAGESGLAGVDVVLYESIGHTAVFTETTDASGLYTFTLVPPGSYYIKFLVTGNYTFTTKDASGVGITDVNDSDVDPATQETGNFTLVAAQEDDTRDAGVYEPVTIGDMIFRDENGDKVQQAGETTGVANVPITLTILATSQTLQTVSDTSGFYSFTNLAPGSYSVSVPPSLPLLLRTTDSPINTTLLSGQQDLNVDFGYINPTFVQIASVTYSVSPQGVRLRWATLSESVDDSFFIYRSTSEEGRRKLMTSEPIWATGSPSGAVYTYIDPFVSEGDTYYYWISIEPQHEVVGPIVVPYYAPEPDDGQTNMVFIPWVVR